MEPPKRSRSEQAVSIQVGFVLNTGILTTFVALVLVIISGGFGEDVSTKEELELAADPIGAKMVEADTLAQTSDGFTAFFQPPSSNVNYVGKVDASGDLSLEAPDGTVVNRSLDDMTIEGVDGGISFTQDTENIIIEYDGNDFDLSVQNSSAREVG